MAVEALVEEKEQQEPKTIVPAPAPFKLDGQQLLEAFTPKETSNETVPTLTRNDTSEVQLSLLGGGESYDDLKSSVLNRDQDRLNKIAQAISTLPAGKPTDIAAALKEIGRTKVPIRTLGGYTAEAILKEHPTLNKEKTGKEFNISEGKNIINNSVMKSFGAKGSYDNFMATPNEAATEAMKIVVPGGKVYEEASNNDLLEFVNPLGGEDPEGMDIQVWKAIKGLATGTFDSEAFDKEMTSNYGEEWVGRFAAFAAKEVAIDGMLLLLAATAVGAPLAATLFGAKNVYRASKLLRYSQVGFKANAKSIAARSVVIGLGGGAAQSAQNYSLDRDLNFGSEVALRLGGAAIFESAALGLRTGFRSLRGRNLEEISKNAAKGGDIKPISRKEINNIMDGEQFATSPYASITREHLFSSIDGYEKVSGEATENLLKLEEASDGVIDGLSAFLGVDRLALKDVQISAIMGDLLKFKTRIDKAGSAAMMKNQEATSQGLTPHLLSLVRGEYGEGNKIAQMYMDGNTLQFRANDTNINSSNMSAVNTVLKGLNLAEPDRVAGRTGADFLDVSNFSNKLANGFVKLYEDAMGRQKIFSKTTTKFNESDLRVINSILEEGDQANKVYDFKNVFPEHVSPEKITSEIEEAYIKTRAIMDLAYELRNSSLTANLRGDISNPKTGKLFIVGEDFVEITERLPNHRFKGRVYDRDNLTSAGGRVVDNLTKASLKEIDSVIPFRNGHIPRGYREHSYSLLALDGNAGKVSRDALFDNRVEAERAFRERNKITGEGQSIALVSNKADSALNGAMFTRNSINVLDAVTKEQREVLSKLLKDMGLNSKSVRFMFKDRPGAGRGAQGGVKGRTDLGTATTKRGKELRVEHAKATAHVANIKAKIKIAKRAKKSTTVLDKALKSAEAQAGRKRAAIIKRLPKEIAPTQESIVEYLGFVAHQSGHDIWQRVGIDHFNSKYGKFLEPEGTWQNAKSGDVFIAKGSNIPSTAMESEIKDFSRFLVRNITKQTFAERWYDRAILGFINKMGKKAVDGNKVALATRKLWDNVPVARDLVNFLRFQTAFPKLLFYPFVQIYIQGSQAITTISAGAAQDIVGLGQAMSQFPRVTAIHARLKFGKRLPPHIKNSDSMKAYDELVASGYNADLSTSDTLWNSKNTMNSGPVGKMIKKINAGGALPFRGGEAINRTTAFLVVRKQLMRQVDKYERALKKGKKTTKELEELAGRGADGEILRARDLGNASYLKAIVNKSKVMAFNMGKAGELEAFSGFGSILFQFKQVGIKQIAMFDSATLSLREKLGAAAGLLGFFGSGAIPFFPDVFKAADTIIFEATGEDPNKLTLASDFAALSAETFADLMGADKEYTKLLLEKGIITAATAGEVDVASRIALGHIVSDTFDVQNWYDLVPASAVFADYVGFARQFALRDINANILNVYSWSEYIAQLASGKSPREAMLKQFDPQSTIGKALAGDSTLLNFTLETIREGGKVYSQFGSISRLMDAANMYEVHPDLDTIHPNVPARFSSSAGKVTNVELTLSRGIQLLTGLTPGLITKEFDKKDLEFRYTEAIKNAGKQLKEDLRRATGNSGVRAINNYGLITRRLRDVAEELDLDIKVVSDGYGKARLMYHNLLVTYALGEELK
jgi:hypothetical protein